MNPYFNDWRLGNLIKSKSYGICELSGFYKNSAWILDEAGIVHQVLGDDLEPITLSLPWLKSFGFDCKNSKQIEMDGRVTDEEIWEYYAPCDELQVWISFNIKLRKWPGYNRIIYRYWWLEMDGEEHDLVLSQKYWVNDLQNIFYQIFGFELEMKNKTFLENSS